jgi:recombination protein RecR
MFSPLVDELIRALRCLPGVGPKSAQRMALYLLERDRPAAERLAHTLLEATQRVHQCQRCRTLCETDLCQFCQNPKRQATQLCVVESPADLFAIEQSGQYHGLYFVLTGHLSPIDGIGPEEIGLPFLYQRICKESLQEIILALNPTVEGEATAYYIAELAKDLPIQISRIAYGIPIGGALDYVDGGTVAKAFMDRTNLQSSKEVIYDNSN